MMLSQRSVMSSLAVPCCGILDASPALAVASIVITGVYGASVGAAVLDAIGITRESAVARGVATGASAHSIGTASLMGKEDAAAAVSSVAMSLAGVFHTVACSVPAVRDALRAVAGCGGGV